MIDDTFVMFLFWFEILEAILNKWTTYKNINKCKLFDNFECGFVYLIILGNGNKFYLFVWNSNCCEICSLF